MTKKDFIHLMSAKADLNLKQSGAAYDAFLKVIEEKLKQDEKLQKEKKLQETVIGIKNKYGKNAIIKAFNLEEGATTLSRNRQIGGHSE